MKNRAGDELRVHRSRGAVAGRLLGVRRLGDLRPHVAERDQTEEVHVVGRAGAGIVGIGQRVLHEPHGRLLQLAERAFCSGSMKGFSASSARSP